MTLKDHSTARYLIGLIEGLGWALPDTHQDAFFTAVETLTEIIDKEVDAND